ncbi:peptidoglycan D,D-transpeptidase FtsI family protein [Subtercola frigoramans]|uniref:Cell division protein FtsI (Penicillin-binding protein 3) n=1 Tax=Subtercola frigoramans TaxID=120298 RepID=A0ABS2L5L7_9MICO|nr:penicillin-binding protein 2 [Subtercola frigoramans]MBM7472391.1 cell division protein FtsI (penicillin-binding protein 3) [Subtercola frigoramans]
MTSIRSTRNRIAVAIIIITAVVAVLVVRLVDIQVVQADSLNKEAYNTLSMAQTIYSPRGDIVDANGTVLATTVIRYTVTASPVQVADFVPTDPATGKDLAPVTPVEAAAQIGAITGQTGDAVYALLTADKTSGYALIVKDLNLDQYNAIRALDIPWLQYSTDPQRVYPNGSVGGNLVGYMGDDTTAGATGTTGTGGLEAMENQCLTGTDGLQTYEKGADGVAIPNTLTVDKAPVTGGTVVTTIDSDLQYYSQQVLAQRVTETGAQWGSVVVEEVKTGKLLAVAQYPTADPNNLDATDSKYWGAIAFSDPFEPGSTFKAESAAALIDAGKATPATQVLTPYRYKSPGGAVVTDSEGHDPAQWTLTGVIQESSNVGISILSAMLTDQQRYDYMKKFHLGENTEVNFLGESEGILRTPQEWDEQTLYNTSFGQGITTTAAQVASMYQTLGNGGVRMPVQLVQGCKGADGTMADTPSTQGEQVISADAAQQTVNMMQSVVTGGYAASLLKIPGYNVAAKTGTAEVSNGQGAYGGGYLTSVAGVAPAEAPQYVVSVNIMKPVTIEDGSASAPVFQKIMSQVLQKYRVLPSTTPAVNYPTDY